MNDKDIIYNLTKELYRVKGIINNVERLVNEAYQVTDQVTGDVGQNLATHFIIRSKLIAICNLVDGVSDVGVGDHG